MDAFHLMIQVDTSIILHYSLNLKKNRMIVSSCVTTKWKANNISFLNLSHD